MNTRQFGGEVMGNNPMVSICCITYNHGPYIAEALESFLTQKTTFPFEIIIGEDCSTDNTRQVVEDYILRYPDKIRLITSENNVGMLPNLCRVLDASIGKYIALCEGDDYWIDSNKLQKQVDFLEANPNVSLHTHDSLKIEAETNREKDRIRPFNKSQIVSIEEFLEKKGGVLPTGSMMFKRLDINGKYPSFFKKAPMGDLPLTLWLGTIGNIYYLDEAWSVYRINVPGSWMTVQQDRRYSVEKRISILNATRKMYLEFDDFSKGFYEYKVKLLTSDIDLSLNIYKKEYRELTSFIKRYGLFIVIKRYILCMYPKVAEILIKIKGGK